MKTLVRLPHSRIALGTALAVVLATSSTQFPPLASINIPWLPTRNVSPTIPHAQPVSVLPFSLQDVETFINQNFSITPIERGPDHAKWIYREESSGGGMEEVLRIEAQVRQNRLQVRFSFREFNAMHYVAEFLESPLFVLGESEQLYALLYTPDKQRAWKKIGRFYALATFENLRDRSELLFDFAPTQPRG